MRFILVVALSILLTNCATIDVNNIQPGRFEGKLNLEWKAPNCFLYVPDPEEPLIFYRANGQKIQPKAMYTDGGSIPRFLWNAPNLSPWDFAPAYLIHDWLFEQHHCFPDQQGFAFKDTAVILAEAVKTMIKSGCVQAEDNFINLIYDSVNSSVAKNLWDSGQCYLPQKSQLEAGNQSFLFDTKKKYDESNKCPFDMPADYCPW